ncbi:hypothetical protein [Rhizobium sp. Nf11,1]|uniref:hypothetical protein n=1 Tax=Rhizobium sp. Nf11,1 TaxID=3404923 RepID=UPI003D3314F1
MKARVVPRSPGSKNGSGSSSNVEPANAEERASAARKEARILIVEDEFLIAFELEDRLRDAGFEGIAATASEAISLAGSERPDLAMMDIRLTGRRVGVDDGCSSTARPSARVVDLLHCKRSERTPPSSSGFDLFGQA